MDRKTDRRPHTRAAGGPKHETDSQEPQERSQREVLADPIHGAQDSQLVASVRQTRYAEGKPGRLSRASTSRRSAMSFRTRRRILTTSCRSSGSVSSIFWNSPPLLCVEPGVRLNSIQERLVKARPLGRDCETGTSRLLSAFQFFDQFDRCANLHPGCQD